MRLHKWFLWLVMSIFPGLLWASDSLKVVKILDTNLFLLNNGHVAKLYNIETYSLNDPDSIKRSFAQNTMELMQKTLFNNNRLSIEKVGETNEGVWLVRAWEVFPLQKELINLRILKLGYAKFVPEIADQDTARFKEAAMKAQKKKRGLWGLRTYPKEWPSNYFYGTSGAILNNSSGIGWLYIPNFTVGYHLGNLISFYKNKNDFVSLSADFGASFLLFFPTLTIGPEVQFKKLNIQTHFGILLPVWIGHFSIDNQSLIQHSTVTIGYRFERKNHKWIGMQLKTYLARGNEDPLVWIQYFSILLPIY